MSAGIVADKFGDFERVNMTPAPGAASKKVIEILSRLVGDEKMHEMAEFLRLERKEKEKKKKKKVRTDEELQTWDPDMMAEHGLHLEALYRSEKTGGMKIQGSSGYIVGAKDEEPVETPATRMKIMEKQMEEGITPGGYGVVVPMDLFKKMAKLLV